MKSTTFFAIFAFFLLPFQSYPSLESLQFAPQQRVRKVVIDAGHGGKDSGALGSKNKEKDITLKIALQLGKYIKTYLQEVEVIYTRTTDEFLPLHERVQMANASHADVFISIHCNSLPKAKKYISGTETYVMGLHKAEENLAVAKRENEVILLEEDYKTHYENYDPSSPEAHIIFSMYQNAYLGQSILLAEKVENQFKTRAKRSSRGVRQAGFVVLCTTTMPSILVETGFLSNAEEEAYLASEKGQIYIASAIYRAFKEYKTEMDERGYQKSTAAYSRTATQENTSDSLVFRVQLAASPVAIDTKVGRWKKVTGLVQWKENQVFKYLQGAYPSLKSAVRQQNHWRKNGFSGAFVVAYYKGKRVSIQRTKEILAR